MTKRELVVTISNLSGLRKADVQKALDAITLVFGEALKKGESVGIMGFGSFSVVTRNARVGRNPKNGAKVQIGAKNVVRFRAGTDLAKGVSSK